MNTYTIIPSPNQNESTIFTKGHWHDAWSGPGSMQKIILENGWTEIGMNAFMDDDDKDLQFIVIPPSVVKISDGAFMGADNLKKIIFENNSQIAEISEDAFLESGLIRVVIDQDALDKLNTFHEIPELHFGENNTFYGHEGVNIVRYEVPEINTTEIDTTEFDPGNVLRRILSTGSGSGNPLPRKPPPIKRVYSSPNGGGKVRTRKRGIRRKSSKPTTRRRRRQKNKSRRRRTNKRRFL